MQLLYLGTPSLFSGLKVRFSADQPLRNLHPMSSPIFTFLGGLVTRYIFLKYARSSVDRYVMRFQNASGPNSDYNCSMQGERI